MSHKILVFVQVSERLEVLCAVEAMRRQEDLCNQRRATKSTDHRAATDFKVAERCHEAGDAASDFRGKEAQENRHTSWRT